MFLAFYAVDTVTVVRVAVTCVVSCRHPTPTLHSNPATDSDTRWAGYGGGNGTDQARQVGSIEPAVPAERVRAAILEHVDQTAWDELVAMQDEVLERPKALGEDWDEEG
jgi:hypothetical protein